MRLNNQLNEYADSFMKDNYPHRTSLVICDCKSDINDKYTEKLQLDMPFDAKTFPLPTTLTVWVETSQQKPSWDELVKYFRELEFLTREELPHIEYFSISLQNKYEEDELKPSEYHSQVLTYDVPKTVIMGDGLEEYLANVKKSQEIELEAISKGEKK